jgi:hypothetical protein
VVEKMRAAGQRTLRLVAAAAVALALLAATVAIQRSSGAELMQGSDEVSLPGMCRVPGAVVQPWQASVED